MLADEEFSSKNPITEQHGITGAYCVYLTFSFSLFTSLNRQEVMFAIRRIAFVIFATPTKQFLLADEEFSSKKLTELSSMELQNVSFAFISRFHFQYSHHSTDGKWCLFAMQKITKAIFATPTKQFLLADEEFSSKKLTELSSMELQNVSNASISRFHFHYSPHSSDRKWCLFAIRKITKAIFATPTKQFFLADKEFSSKTHITEQHGITEREYCVYLTFSISLFTSVNGQEVMFVWDSKDNKSYLRDTNKTIFASR